MFTDFQSSLTAEKTTKFLTKQLRERHHNSLVMLVPLCEIQTFKNDTNFAKITTKS